MIPRYSLRRLFVNLSVLCCALALISYFPVASRAFTSTLLLCAPSLLVIGVACWFSERRIQTFSIVSLGALLGWLLSPRLGVSWGGVPTFWDYFLVDFHSVGMFSAAGAVMFAVAECLIRNAAGRPRKRNVELPPGSRLRVEIPDARSSAT